jgi:hypothetical protein
MNLNELADDYLDATNDFLDAARVALGQPERLDRSVEGGWSARQVIHHVADSETQSSIRLRRLLAEPLGTEIQGYDEDTWSRTPALGYRELPVEPAIELFRAVRATTLAIVRRLDPADLERHGVHSTSGRYDVAEWFEIYRNHPRYHAQQLLEALES